MFSVPDSKLASPDLLRAAVSPQEEHLASRHQGSEHLHRLQQATQAGRLRHLQNPQVGPISRLFIKIFQLKLFIWAVEQTFSKTDFLY